MFSYNTSLHKSIGNTPFFLTFGMEPRAPHFPVPDLRRIFYGESEADDMLHRLHKARMIARDHNETARDDYKKHYDAKVTHPLRYQVGQKVLLDEHAFLHKNRKLAPNWSGPHVITRLLHDTNVELLLANNKRSVVHINRLKPFLTNLPFDVPVPPITKKKPSKPVSDNEDRLDESVDETDQLIPNDDANDDINREQIPFLPAQAVLPTASHSPPKRGRPKGVISKTRERLPPLPIIENQLMPPSVETPQSTPQQQPKAIASKDFFHGDSGVDKLPQTELRLTRSQARTLTTQLSALVNTITKKRKKKKDGPSNANRVQERNFKKTGDTFGTTVPIYNHEYGPPMHPPLDDQPVSDDEDGEEEGEGTSTEHSDVEDSEHDTGEEESDEDEEDVPQPDVRPDGPNQDKQPDQPVPPMPRGGLPPILPPRGNLLSPPKKPDISWWVPTQSAHPSMGPISTQVPPHELMLGTSDVLPGGGPQSSTTIPQPPLHSGGTTHVPHTQGGAIPKDSQFRKNTLQATSREAHKEEPENAPSKMGTKDQKAPTEQSSTRPQPKSAPLSTGTRMVTPTNVPPEAMRQITQLMGKTIRATDQIKHNETLQQLHDILFLTPGFFTIDDITRDNALKTDECRKVFESANHHKMFHTDQTTTRTTDSKADRRTTEKTSARQPGLAQRAGPTPAQRTSRSNTKAPDIPPTPSVPIEHQSRRQQPK